MGYIKEREARDRMKFCLLFNPHSFETGNLWLINQAYQSRGILFVCKRLFEKWLAVILIELLPPLIPPYKGGKPENLVPSPL
jgi:hypothetical protein